MDKYLVDVYTIRSRFNSPLQNPAPNFISETTLSPRKRPYRATKHPMKNAHFNLTKSQFLENRQNEKVAAILKAENNPPPNFEIDELNVQSRRFDSIRKDSLKRKDEYLREIYFLKYDYGVKAKSRKNRTIRLMEQFIYETQYKLTYVQVLRKKYILQPRYRIGYCFSLLANLRNQQFVLFDALRRNKEIWTTLYIHLKLYEKIVRLDVDIRDLIAYIKKINWDRMPKEEPVYFDSVKHMQQ
ncbi:unnamed protein product [Pieris macdunnoughi]|uniref:Uncharacterized protein n=1 Tax=Pieris macdunnoughi TaxID=345717 RepID=A0A821WM12_9NEOP|nr:unnamed protein product [Pieris macdunnoughi]